jgi:hypothetical protein
MSDASLQVAKKFYDPGAKLAQRLGRPVGVIHAAKSTLFAEVVDDSSSIDEFNNTQAVMDGRNEVINALRGANSLQRDGLSVLTIRMNAGPLDTQNLFLGIMDVPLLDHSNYRSSGVTPLYQRTVEAALLLIAAAEAQLRKGVKSSLLLHIITDGEDVPLDARSGGKHTTPAEVAKVLEDLRRREDSLIRATGIPGNRRIDFHQVFGAMGILPAEIVDIQAGTQADRGKAIRAHFQQFSSAALGFTNAAYGQSKQGFITGTQQAGGGFLGNP